MRTGRPRGKRNPGYDDKHQKVISLFKERPTAKLMEYELKCGVSYETARLWIKAYKLQTA